MSFIQQPLGILKGVLPRSLADILPPGHGSGPGSSQHASTRTLLPLVGLISSASALTFAYAEATYLSPLQDERVSPVAIRTVWEKSFPFGLGIVLALGVGSLVGGLAGYRLADPGSTAKTLYAAGTIFSLAHFAFVPSIAAALGPIFREKSGSTQGAEAQFKDSNRKWLRLHALRAFVSDIPALVCFAAATAMDGHT